MKKWYWVVRKNKRGQIMRGAGFSAFNYTDLKIEERDDVVSIHEGTQGQIMTLVQLRDADEKPLVKQHFIEDFLNQMKKVK